MLAAQFAPLPRNRSIAVEAPSPTADSMNDNTVVELSNAAFVAHCFLLVAKPFGRVTIRNFAGVPLTLVASSVSA